MKRVAELKMLDAQRSDTHLQVGETRGVTRDSLTKGGTRVRQKSVKPWRPFLDDERAFLLEVSVVCGSRATCSHPPERFPVLRQCAWASVSGQLPQGKNHHAQSCRVESHIGVDTYSSSRVGLSNVANLLCTEFTKLVELSAADILFVRVDREHAPVQATCQNSV